MSNATTRPCSTVAKGGVGESGPTAILEHQVTGTREIVMVLRNVETNLCGNTGAIAILVVNGRPVDHEVITDQGSSIQAPAKPGDQVVGLVHSMPLYNGVICTHLGELNVELQQCELVT